MPPTTGQILPTCLRAPRPLLEDVALGGSKCSQCLGCTGDCLDICSDCARDLWSDFHDERYSDCTKKCADSELRDQEKCKGLKQECYTAEGMGPHGQAECRLIFHCDEATCTYNTDPILEFCEFGCVYGQSGITGVMDTDCEEVPCPTVTVTTAVHDSSGNPMAAGYVWSFHTEVGTRIYLPLVLKH